MVIKFQDQEPAGAVAKLEADTVPSNFVPLGAATQAVVMRLSSKRPRIRVFKAGSPQPREETKEKSPR